MKYSSARKLSELRAVLKDPNSTGPDPVYWVFSEATDPLAIDKSQGAAWANVTLITAGRYGNEYPKTFGHYHGSPVDETYYVIEGDGVLQLQKKKIVDGKWVENEVEEVFLVKVKVGEKIVIPPDYGHGWSNLGVGPLISLDDWRSGHSDADYEPIKRMQGLAFYLVEENGEVKAVPNPKYSNLPEPQWVSVDEWNQKLSS